MMRSSVRALNSQYSLRSHAAARTAAVRFAQASSGADQPQLDNDKTTTRKDQDSKIRKMKTTPGGGYGMRADEQGYGAVHKGNSSISAEDEEKLMHGSPEYDGYDEVPEVKKEK